MAEMIILSILYALAIPLLYLALWVADRIRPIDVSLRRRLLLVILSIVITTPIALVSWFLYPLIFIIDWLLIRWVYVDSWGGAAIRTLLWYVFTAIFAMVLGFLLVLVPLLLGLPFLLS